jgi:hypothetical protein
MVHHTVDVKELRELFYWILPIYIYIYIFVCVCVYVFLYQYALKYSGLFKNQVQTFLSLSFKSGRSLLAAWRRWRPSRPMNSTDANYSQHNVKCIHRGKISSDFTLEINPRHQDFNTINNPMALWLLFSLVPQFLRKSLACCLTCWCQSIDCHCSSFIVPKLWHKEWKIWSFHDGDYEQGHLLGCDVTLLL